MSIDLDHAAASADHLLVPAQKLARDLSDALVSRGARSGALCIRAGLDTGVELERTWTCVDARVAADVLDRVRWQVRGWLDGGSLADRDGQARGIVRLELCALDVEDAPAVPSPLWGPGEHEEAVDRALRRIQALLGDDAVRSVHVGGGWDPRTRVTVSPYGHPAPGERAGEWAGAVEAEPSVLFEEPLPVDLVAAVPDSIAGLDGGPLVPRVRSLPVAGAGGESVRVGERGVLDAEPRHLVLDPSVSAWQRSTLPACLAPLADAGWVPVGLAQGPWIVHGRWWEPGAGARGSRAHLLLSSPLVPDLLVVHRDGRWWLDGVLEESGAGARGGV